MAVKVLPEAVAGDPGRLARFEREARALARLSHPSILSIFDFGTEGETAYAVTELLEGETLRERLDHERLPWRRAVEIAASVAEGLSSAHSAGIVHRDLKPENIFLTRDGRTKILDFGLAREETPGPECGPAATLSLDTGGTAPGTVLGTVGYMAPEQVRGETADARSDIFSLGCVLYEMLTGQRPFQRDTAAETMTAILKDPAPEVALSGTDISSDLDRVVARCLEKNPAERFQSASDLAFSLREIAKAASGPSQPRMKTPRRQKAAAILIASLLVLAAAAVFFWLRSPRLQKRIETGAVTGERIAVLPFENLGAVDDAYFAAGITDEITGRLASVGGLAVISRACAAQYAGTAKTTHQIGTELEVQYLLTGTVRWARGAGAAERVRVTPALIRVADDTSLWSHIYEFTMDDIFAIQSEIARSVVSELGLKLLGPEKGSIEARPTNDMEAYHAFLRGRFLARQPHFTLTTWLQALRDFQEAVERDPGFALAWAELARGHARLVYYRYDLSAERHDLARRALSRARELDPDSPEVRLAAGYCHLWVERDTAAALAEFEAASRFLHNSVEIQSALGELFRMRGDWQRGLDAYKAASSLSPRDGSVMVDLAETLWWLRRYPQALEASDRAIVLAPGQAWPYLVKVFTLWSWKGTEALAEAGAAAGALPADHEWTEWTRFWQEAFASKYDEALRRMEADPEGWVRLKIQVAPKLLLAAVLRAALGDMVRAREEFEAARKMLESEMQSVPEDARYHSSLGVALAGLGLRDEALREGRLGIELLPVSSDAVYGISHVIDLAHIHTLLGDKDMAVKQLESLLSRPGWISEPFLRMDPRWIPLQGDPGFERLLAEYAVKR